MTARPLTGDRVRACAKEQRLSLMDAKRACILADERFEGDDELGALWLSADALAVNVRGDRAAWNDSWARQQKSLRSQKTDH